MQAIQQTKEFFHVQNLSGTNFTFSKFPPSPPPAKTINENCSVSKVPGKEEKAKF